MAAIDDTKAVLLSVYIDGIREDWINEVWARDFCDIEPIPEELKAILAGSTELPDNLVQLHDMLLPWVNGSHQLAPTQTFWMVLSDSGISVKYLIVLLHHLMELAEMKSAGVGRRIVGSIAAGIYFLLLRIPGCRAFKVFHLDVFDHALKIFQTLTCAVNNSSKKRPNKTHGKQQTKRQKKQVVNTELESSCDEDEVDDDEVDILKLSGPDVERLRLSCVGLLKDFVHLLEDFPELEGNDFSYKVISCLIELCHIEATGYDGNLSNQTCVEDMDNIAQLSFNGLLAICATKRLNVISNVLKLLLPNILLQEVDSSLLMNANAVSSSLLAVRDHSVSLVCWLVKQLNVEGLIKRVYIFIQHICVKVPERTEFRSKVAQAIIVIMKCLPAVDYMQTLEWIIKYSKNIKIQYRIFGLDLITLLLDDQDRFNVIENQQFNSSRQSLVEFIIERCSDIAPSVRARAMLSFEQCSSSANPTVSGIIKGIVTPSISDRPAAPKMLVKTPTCFRVASDRENTGNEEVNEIAVDRNIVTRDSDNACPMTAVTIASSEEISLLDNFGVMSMMRRRSGDDKINVRKASLQVLEKIIKLEGENFTLANVDILKERCRDPAVSVRKQALQSLTDLLHEFPLNDYIIKSWLAGVLPMILDAETGVQLKSYELIVNALFDNIVAYDHSTSDCHHLAWSLLALVSDSDHVELSRYIQKVCHLYGKAGGYTSKLMSALRSHVDTENNAGAWLILSEAVSFVTNFKTEFISDYWRQHVSDKSDTANLINIRVLSTLSKVANHVSSTVRSYFADELKQVIMKFESSPDLIVTIVNSLYAISESSKPAIDEWFGEVLRTCDEYLSKVILTTCESYFDEEKAVRVLFTLGEISQFYPSLVPSRVFLLVQSIIASPAITSLDGSSQTSQSQASSQQGVFSQFRGSIMSTRLRAFAFITLGKLCLQSDVIAKKCVPALARELEISNDVSIRNNVVVVMCDLCVRYTSLVDCYVPCISACLRDPSLLIRRQTLTLLTNLLQEDYLKWKGSLLFRFISSTVDEDEDIAQFASFCLIQLLTKRSPGLFFVHFVDSLFYFNQYDGHAVYNKFNETEREKKLFSLEGASCANKRRHIYRLMLEHMTDDQRFRVMGKLIQEVLVPIVDEVMPLDTATSAILQDTLACLSCKEIKLTALRAKTADEFAETDNEVANAVLNVAKKTLISQVTKKAFVETTVPVLISLKHMLEKYHSPVMKDFMVCLRELMKDYKTEIKDMLAIDKQLASEIEFDLRKFDEKQPNGRQHQLPSTIDVAVLQAIPTLAQPASPVARLQSAGTGDNMLSPAAPSRSVSLATIAVINSARKIMEKAKLNASGSLPGTPAASRQSDVAMQQRHTQTATRVHRTNYARAISTPAVHRNVDITFTANNVSVIQGSPPTFCHNEEGSRHEDGSKLPLTSANNNDVIVQPLNLVNVDATDCQDAISSQVTKFRALTTRDTEETVQKENRRRSNNCS